MFDRLKNIAFFCCIVLLSSCGGGGEDEQSPKPVEPITVPVDTSTPVKPANVNTHTLSGMAVKGPLANADIFIYTFDASKLHFKGDLIDSGKSSAEALFNDVDIPEPLNDVYIVEIKANSGTVDLNTGRPPIIDTMYTYVTSEQIKLGTRIHATPLTTLVLIATENNLHETSNENDLKQAFLDAKHQVINALNLSIIEDIDLITQVPVVTAEESNLIKIASYRTAIESISALLFQASKQTNIGINELISTLASDAIDGEIDGSQNGKTIANYESLPSLLVEFKAIDINTLVIPYTKNAETGEPYKVNEVELLLVSEKLILNIGSDVDTSKFSTGEIDITSTPIGEDFDNDNMPDLIDTDDDNDGILDSSDAFPLDSTESLDSDSDGVGNNADTDDDNDGILDSSDAFPLDSTESLDSDSDGVGNNADTDDDNDGILDSSDAFPLDRVESLDTDSDGVGNNADTDDDNDGILDSSDAFPLDRVESLDTDSDGVGNNADTDDDNDGVTDSSDAFPLDSVESLDTDNDGIGNNADADDDNDGVIDSSDAFPLDSTESLDTDNDGIGNNADADDDNDGVIDSNDAFPLDRVESLDTDSDGVGNNADTDDDNDGVTDSSDAFPLDSTEYLDTDNDGIGNNADADDDNDGVIDSNDALPLDNTESIDTDHDGVGNNADTDDDNDGVIDSSDAFPLDSTEYLDTDNDGIGNNADADDDNDGVIDSNDALPLDNSESIDTDHDGVGNNADTDDDNDGVLDNADDFPLDSAESLDTDNDGMGNNADTDDDNDDVLDDVDAFPLDAFEFIDTDSDGVGDNVDDDDDGDGIADNWEIFYGFDPLLATDAHEDLDGDSISNLSEFVQDSIPTDASSITPLIRQVKFSFEDGDVPLGWVIDDEFADWIVDSLDSSDGHNNLTANNKAAIQYNAHFEGNELSLDVKVGIGTLSLFVDGKRVLNHRGNNMWTTLKVRIPQGNHNIRVESPWGSPTRIDNIIIEPLINIFEQDIAVVAFKTDKLKFYSHDGELFREEIIPEGFFTRNFVILDNGSIAFNTGHGSTPVLRIYTPETHTWRYNKINVWQSIFSGMETLGNYIYMTNVSNYPGASGLIQFNVDDGSYTRFGTGHYYPDIFIGPDNNLYAVSFFLDYKIDVYNPETMALLRTIPLPLDQLKQPRKIILDDIGNIYILTDLSKILKFNSMGILLNELSDLPPSTIGSIQLNNGKLVVTNAHDTFIVETDLSSFKLHNNKQNLSYFHNVYHIDEDEDELPLWWENKYSLNDKDSSDADGDKDLDLITNSDEFKINTIPTIADTDGDRLNDGDEVLLHYTDPLSADSDSDGLSDGEEVYDYMTLPLVFDTDNDQFSDGSEVDIFTSDPNDPNSMPEHFDSMLESFEADNLPLGWIKPSDIENTWNINDEQSILGMRSLKAEVLDNFESAEIQFSGVFLKGAFSFSALTNNDICCSVIIFYLDGEQLFVHRSKAWQEYFVDIEAGEHTFKWEYRKNTINDAYIDGGWIDNIQFTKN